MSNKVITLIPRKPGTTRAAFKDYYENNHAPLGTRYFPFDKYVRNHLVASHPEDLGFDVLMELWLDHGKAMATPHRRNRTDFRRRRGALHGCAAAA